MDWSLQAGASEFGVGRDTLRKALTDAGHKLTGERVTFSTRTIHEALSKRGGLEAAREAETWERHRQLTLENEKAEGTHWDREECLALIASMEQPRRARIMSMPTILAPQVNPSDPPHAYAVLTGWVESAMQLFREDVSAVAEPKDKTE